MRRITASSWSGCGANLRRAREQELTPRQREMLALYYDRGLKMSQIAQKLGVNRSTVSRTVKRAKAAAVPLPAVRPVNFPSCGFAGYTV